MIKLNNQNPCQTAGVLSAKRITKMRSLTVYYTSDTHGYFSPIDYATGNAADTGLANCAANFAHDGNSLIIDGGDTLQGSPFTYWLFSRSDEKSSAVAKLINIAGYDFVTLGNHDFNYGKAELERYLSMLNARCLCANIEGLSHVEKTAVVTLENGLRVGLTGVCTHYVPHWEKEENIDGIRFNDAFTAAKEALNELTEQGVDLTVCIYHGGYELDVDTAAPISDSGENQGYRICKELDFDLLLCAHQHMEMAGRCLYGTQTCQLPANAKKYAVAKLSLKDDGSVKAETSLYNAGDKSHFEAIEFLKPLEEKTAEFLDTPLGTLDVPLPADSSLAMASQGSLIANFFNQVQLDASKAQISVTCLSDYVRGFSEKVTVRNIVASYVFANTLKVISVDRAIIKAALERSAEFFSLDEHGKLTISESFLKPVPQFYNYDFFSQIEATIDVRRNTGDRVVSIKYRGEELEPERVLSLCLNNYRASGAGGYEFYKRCESISESADEISSLIISYVDRNRNISVDKSKYLKLIY